MTRAELDYLKKILTRIKNPDAHVEKAIAFVDKDIALYNSRRGQLRDQYEVDERYW